MTQTFARVVDGIVAEIVNIPDEASLDDCFQADIAKTFVSSAATVQQGYIYDGKTFSAPVEPPITSDDLLTYAAAKRFSVETGGIMVDGDKLATDRASQSLVTGAYAYVQANPEVTVKFKTSAGFVELTAAQMTAIANAVGAHVQASFAAEASVAAEISSQVVKTFADIDAFAWPANA